jgi:hypothetical protein
MVCTFVCTAKKLFGSPMKFGLPGGLSMYSKLTQYGNRSLTHYYAYNEAVVASFSNGQVNTLLSQQLWQLIYCMASFKSIQWISVTAVPGNSLLYGRKVFGQWGVCRPCLNSSFVLHVLNWFLCIQDCVQPTPGFCERQSNTSMLLVPMAGL